MNKHEQEWRISLSYLSLPTLPFEKRSYIDTHRYTRLPIVIYIYIDLCQCITTQNINTINITNDIQQRQCASIVNDTSRIQSLTVNNPLPHCIDVVRIESKIQVSIIKIYFIIPSHLLNSMSNLTQRHEFYYIYEDHSPPPSCIGTCHPLPLSNVQLYPTIPLNKHE